VSAHKPYMVLPGNHEADCHFLGCIPYVGKLWNQLKNFTAYNHRYRMFDLFWSLIIQFIWIVG